MTISDFVLLSDDTERVLHKLINKASENKISSDYIIFSSTDAEFNFNRETVCKELLNANYISKFWMIGQHRTRRFSCLLDARAFQYFDIKQNYQYKEAKKMFINLTGEARELLLNLVEHIGNIYSYINNEYQIGDPNLKRTLDYLQERGFLTYKQDITGLFDVDLKYSGEHYLDLEKEFLEERNAQQQKVFNVKGSTVIFQNGNNNTASISNNNELAKIIESIRDLLPANLPDDDKALIIDNAEVIKEEMQKENPKKGFVKTAIRGLQSVLPKIVNAVELSSAITSVIQFVSSAL